MKKTIRVLSVGSAAIYGLSFLLLLLAILLQTVLVPAIYKTTEQVFIIPAAPVVCGVAMLGLALLACVLNGSEKVGLWLSILLVALAVLVITPLNSILMTSQSAILAQTKGSTALLSLNMVNALASLMTCLNPLAYGLFLVSSGMCITYKSMNKKIQKAL